MNANLIKQAYKLGYEFGMEKHAGPRPDERAQVSRLMNRNAGSWKQPGPPKQIRPNPAVARPQPEPYVPKRIRPNPASTRPQPEPPRLLQLRPYELQRDWLGKYLDLDSPVQPKPDPLKMTPAERSARLANRATWPNAAQGVQPAQPANRENQPVIINGKPAKSIEERSAKFRKAWNEGDDAYRAQLLAKARNRISQIQNSDARDRAAAELKFLTGQNLQPALTPRTSLPSQPAQPVAQPQQPGKEEPKKPWEDNPNWWNEPVVWEKSKQPYPLQRAKNWLGKFLGY